MINTDKDAALYLNNRNGGIINCSKTVLLAYKKHGGRELDFSICAREEALAAREAIIKSAMLDGEKIMIWGKWVKLPLFYYEVLIIRQTT